MIIKIFKFDYLEFFIIKFNALTISFMYVSQANKYHNAQQKLDDRAVLSQYAQSMKTTSL